MNLENQFTFGNTFSYSNLQMYFENDSSSTRIVRAEGDELDGFWNKNRWVHAVIVLEKDSQLKIFKNGKFIKFRQVTTPKRVLRTSQVLGKDISKNDVGFKGQLDDFRMYDRAISSEEVKGLFNLVSSKNPKIEHVPYTFTVLVKTGNGGKADGTRDLKVKLEVLGLKDSIKASYPLRKSGTVGFAKDL